MTPDDSNDVTQHHFNAVLMLILMSAFAPFKWIRFIQVQRQCLLLGFTKVGQALLDIIILVLLSAHVISFFLSSLSHLYLLVSLCGSTIAIQTTQTRVKRVYNATPPPKYWRFASLIVYNNHKKVFGHVLCKWTMAYLGACRCMTPLAISHWQLFWKSMC